MNPVLERILRTGETVTRDGKAVSVHSAISPEEGRFIQETIRRVRPRRSLEIGMAYAVSTLYICDALQEVGAERHVSVDPHQFGIPASDLFQTDDRRGWEGAGWKADQDAGYGALVELRAEPSHLALPRLLSEGYRCEFAFIDGWHTFDYVMLDFFYVDKMLRPGGVVVFDDAGYASVRKVGRYVVKNLPYVAYPEPGRGGRKLLPGRWLKPEIIEPDGLLGIGRDFVALRKVREDMLGGGENDTRRWDDHEPF